MITISTPGKLILAGEWSILELGNTALVMAIDRFVNVSIEPSSTITFESESLGIPSATFSYSYPHLELLSELHSDHKKTIECVHNAIEIALTYLHENKMRLKPFSLKSYSPHTTHTTEEGKTVKLGIGSSAAATVGIIKALLAFHGLDTDDEASKNILFKLAYIAHEITQNKVGSGFDIAASTWGTTIAYQRFDFNWLHKQQKQKTLSALTALPWPLLKIKPLCIPKNLHLSVGFVGYSASTPLLIKKMMIFKKKHPSFYKNHIKKINDSVLSLSEALEKKDVSKILESITHNRNLLKKLSDKSGCNLETQELTQLIELAQISGGTAKFSGAGGGDCGIAICFDSGIKATIEKAWKENTIVPIELNYL